MNFLDKLIEASTSLENLSEFIQHNSIEIYDFFISQKHISILEYKEEIKNYIFNQRNIYKELNFSDERNKLFLFCLLDVSQRFGLASEFQQLCNFAEKYKIELNERLKASTKFLLHINTINDYDKRITEIFEILRDSFLEEDDEQKTIATLVYFYKEVFHNFQHNKEGVIDFKNKLIKELQKKKYKFLYTQSVKEILSYSLDNIEELKKIVNNKLDEILGRVSQYPIFNTDSYLIESDGFYAEHLSGVSANFEKIQKLCADLYLSVKNDEIFRSLQRGVKILTEENQLLAYISSYGKMHQAKFLSAIKEVQLNDFQEEFEIYDWGCGQGLASICLLEHLGSKDITTTIKKIVLIEPSEIALKRASLHVRKFRSDTQIITINKDLDSLDKNDFKSESHQTKIHLFSNILDIDFFSMAHLIKLIEENFKGKNIFICVSPFISNIKTRRIDDFVESFRSCTDFQLISSISQKRGEWKWNGSWTRVIRVFRSWI